jgi:phosphoribosylformylglycinamidine synthase
MWHAARDISDGGIAVALAEACFAHGVGVDVTLPPVAQGMSAGEQLFAETPSRALVAVPAEQVQRLQQILSAGDVTARILGRVTPRRETGGEFKISLAGADKPVISCHIRDLKQPWADALEDALHSEVPA